MSDEYYSQGWPKEKGSIFTTLVEMCPSVDSDPHKEQEVIIYHDGDEITIDESLHFTLEGPSGPKSGFISEMVADTQLMSYDGVGSVSAESFQYEGDFDLALKANVTEPKSDAGELLDIRPEIDLVKHMDGRREVLSRNFHARSKTKAEPGTDWLCEDCGEAVEPGDYVEDNDGNKYCNMDHLYNEI